MMVGILRPAMISVILPVYNGAQWIAGAIQCVLDQSFTDFELLIIDDGSKDDSWSVISSFNDVRIRASRQENRGLAATLNTLVSLAHTPFVARQDQDDWMHPARLEKQIRFMQGNPGCVGVGTWAEIRREDQATSRAHRHPTQHDALRLMLLFDNPFVHSSMMLRKDALLAAGGYCEDRSLQPPEDYDLWARLAEQGELFNLPEFLTAYREVAGSMSRTGVSPFQRNILRISSEALLRLLASDASKEECLALSALYHGVRVTAGLKLSRARAMDLFDAAASKLVFGQGPSLEFNEVYGRLRRHIASQTIRRHLPLVALNLYRSLRRAVG